MNLSGGKKIYFGEAKNLDWVSNSEHSKTKVIFSGVRGGPRFQISYIEPGYKTPPHYHPTDQFQIILEGDALFPQHTVGPLDTHYTDASRPYGPFTTGSEGMIIAVLRRKFVGNIRMDQPGPKKPFLKGRELFGLERKAVWEDVSKDIRRKVIIGKGGDAPQVEILECKPGALVQTGPAPNGQYVILYRGLWKAEGRAFESYAVLYVESVEPSPPVTCGPNGAIVIVANYDRPVRAS